jgi:hypothetical protein
MDGIAEQGPAPTPRQRKPFDFTKFNDLMGALERWRTDDHEDNLVLCRSDVIEIIEGVKALRGVGD